MKLKDFTVITKLLIDPFLTEAMKVPQLKIKDEEVKQEILENGLYHFTSSESADKIMSSGHIRPTKGFINNHTIGNRVFMFSSVPDFNLYIKNMDLKDDPVKNGNFELTAINMKIKDEELKKYKTRPQDNAVSYKGKCDISNKDTSKVSFVIDLDENKEFVIREKTEEESKKGYIPSEELLQKQQEYKTNTFKQTINRTLIESEYTNQNLKNIFQRMFIRAKGIIQNFKKTNDLKLEDGVTTNDSNGSKTNVEQSGFDLDESLQDDVYNLEDADTSNKYLDDVVNETKEPEVLIPNYMNKSELE